MRNGGVGLGIGACVEHAAEVADAAAKRVKVNAVVLLVIVVVVAVVVGGGGGGRDGGSQWGPWRHIRCCVHCRCWDRHLLSSLGGAGVHKLGGPQVRGRGALAVADNGDGAAALRRLVL